MEQNEKEKFVFMNDDKVNRKRKVDESCACIGLNSK